MTQGQLTDERPSEELASIVFDLFGVSIAESDEAWQGEESIGWRGSSHDGDRFVQRLPAWRALDELAWCDSVARAASTIAPACVHAFPSRNGATVVATPEGPVMVFPVRGGNASGR